MSTTGKTPSSLLTEILRHQGILPIYSEQQIACGSRTEFTCQVTINNTVSASGAGRSKRAARQDAAKNALEILKLSGAGELQVADPALYSYTDNVISPYEAETNENEVGKLNDFCSSHGLPSPVYNPIREDGSPHAKHFEFSCTVRAMTEFAVGRTKKQAKHLAARKIIDKMQQLNWSETDPSEGSTNGLPNDPNVKALIKYSKVKGTKLSGMKLGKGFINTWTKEQLAFLQSFKPTSDNASQMLENICKELELSIETTVDVPTVVGKQCKNKVVIVTVSTTPQTSFLGIGEDADEATRDASKRAIEYLQIMMQ